MKINPIIEYFTDFDDNDKEVQIAVLRIYDEGKNLLAESKKFKKGESESLIYDNITYLVVPNGEIFVSWNSLIRKFK